MDKRQSGSWYTPTRRRIKDLLSHKDRGVGSSSGIAGVLSRLFIQILEDLGVNGVRWKYLMDRYVDQEVKHFDNRRDRTSIRGNMNKEFLRPRMSWKVFCKAMMFLDFVSFEIQIHAKHRDGTVTVHRTIVDYTTKDEPNMQIVDPESPGQLEKFIELVPETGEVQKEEQQ